MMDKNKTKVQLINELEELRTRIASLEVSRVERHRDGREVREAEEILRKSEESYRAVVEDQTELICRFLPDKTLTFVNSAHCRYFGLKRDELIGTSFMRLIPESEHEYVESHFASLGIESPVAMLEHQVVAPNGEICWQQWTNRAILDDEERIIEFQSVGRDITKRKQAEEALHKAHDDMEQKVKESTSELLEVNEQLRVSEAHMRGILNAAPAGVGLVRNRELDWVSERMCEMIGYSADELVGQSARIAYESDEEFERVGKVKYSEIQERGVGTVETRFKRKDGSVINVLLSSSAVDSSDFSKGTIFTVFDITERKQMEEALRESEEKYRRLVESSIDGIAIVQGTKMKFANKAMMDMYGASGAEEIIGHNFTKFVAHEYRDLLMKRGLERERGEDVPTRYEFKALKLDESEFDVEISVNPISYEGKPARQAFLRDITERKRAEEALRESEERHRMLLEASPDPIVVYDIEGRATYVNPAFVETFRWSSEELLGERIEFVPEENWPETRVAIGRMLRGEKIQSFETRRLTKDGRILDIQLSSSVFHDRDDNPAGNVVILRDITKRKEAENALLKSEAELAEQSRHLEEVNAALKALLRQRENDKVDLEQRLLANVKELVLPYVEKLKKSRSYSDRMTLVGILESNVKEIVSPFVTKLSSRFLSLTPTEIQVASLIKDGKTSKEIAVLLNASENTVRSHRFHIRSKLGIKNKKVNFRSYLQSLQD
jgi:PAS domain S-box-containing protein